MEIQIGKHTIGENHPVYFIADISANHDGDLERAKYLIHLAAQAGANAAKFQNFRAPKIVSDYGFRSMQGQVSHQAKWKKSVSEVYAGASIPFEWTPELKEACDEAGIDYFSAPYDFDAIDCSIRMYRPTRLVPGILTGSNRWNAWRARTNPCC
jgi:sialic acid synthase SpsE